MSIQRLESPLLKAQHACAKQLCHHPQFEILRQSMATRATTLSCASASSPWMLQGTSPACDGRYLCSEGNADGRAQCKAQGVGITARCELNFCSRAVCTVCPVMAGGVRCITCGMCSMPNARAFGRYNAICAAKNRVLAKFWSIFFKE